MIGDPDSWTETGCIPKQETKGASCCLPENSDECAYWGNYAQRWVYINSTYVNGTEFCPTQILANRDQECMGDYCTGSVVRTCVDYDIGDWPRKSFSAEFLQTESTFQCWTNCEHYLDA